MSTHVAAELEVNSQGRSRSQGHQEEVSHSKFRRWMDTIVFTFLLLFQRIPSTYWVLRNSVCPEVPNGNGPFLASLAEDDWLATFPCEAYQPASHIVQVNNSVFNSISDFFDEPYDARAWYLCNLWWAFPHIAIRHSFVENGGALIFGPCILFVPLYVEEWWSDGGRSLCISCYRAWGHMVMFHQLLFGESGSCLHWTKHNPHTYAAKVLLTCGVLGALPWQMQRWQVLLEILSICILAVAGVGFQPPSTLWLLKLFGGVFVAGSVVLAISAGEASILPYVVDCRAEPPRSHGPVHALKQLLVGVPTAACNAVFSVWTAAFLVFCLYCTLFSFLPPTSAMPLF